MKVSRRLLVLATALALTNVTVSTVQAAPGVPNLGPGSTGQGVRCVQNGYNRIAGAGLAVDGSYGPATMEATRNFQRYFGLRVDGVVGPITGGLLGQAVNTKGGVDIWRLSGCYAVVPG
jgi:peptidoglycan hydrolase-like protein with peptidoglycan-binding domain